MNFFPKKEKVCHLNLFSADEDVYEKVLMKNVFTNLSSLDQI